MRSWVRAPSGPPIKSKVQIPNLQNSNKFQNPNRQIPNKFQNSKFQTNLKLQTKPKFQISISDLAQETTPTIFYPESICVIREICG